MKPENMTILTVDDTPANIRLLTHYLEKEGYNVLTAEDGFEGFKSAIKYHPDLVLLDVMMPGTDGYEVCELLKAEETTKDIPIVFLTAKTDVEDRLHGFELGAKDFITKPFNLSEISTRIKTQLELTYLKIQNEHLSEALFSSQRAAGSGYIGLKLSTQIKSFLDMLHSRLKRIQEKADPDSAVQQAASIAVELESRIKLLVETWYDFADEKPEIPRVFNLVPLLIDIVELIEFNVEGISVKYSVPEEPVMIESRYSLIQQAMIALLVNLSAEVKYQGGIEISSSMGRLPKRFENQLKEKPESEYLHISIQCECKWGTDDIPSVELENFYFSKNHPDAAFGLTVASAFVTRYQGIAAIEQGNSNGVMISLYIPANSAA